MLFIFQRSVTNLLRKQTVHNEEHNPLKAAKDGEQVKHDYSSLLKLETSEDPRSAQHTQLSHCSNGECPAGGTKDTHVQNLTHLKKAYFLWN